MNKAWLLLAALLPVSSPQAATYHLSSRGNDAATGTSPNRPWRTFERLNRARLGPGDRILLKAGDRFSGRMVIAASGAPGRPLRIGRYGAGAKPLIAGDGHAAAILIRNQQHIEISDLEITNDVVQARPGEPAERSFGIDVVNDGGGVLAHFRLERLTIRDVYAQSFSDRTEEDFNRVIISAIRFVTERAPADQPALFRDIVIADNDISRSGRFGVQISHAGGGAGRQDAHSRDPETGFNRDIVIRGNRFVELGGTGVLLAGARNVLLEDNDFDRTGSSAVPQRMVGRGSGAWVFNSRDIVAQHNQSRHVRGYKDSYGLHVDYGNLNILYQYNYSEDSEGGFVEILGNNRNIIWRYNISVNDGLREKAGNTLWISPFSDGMISSEGIHIHNNSIFVRPGLYPDLDFRTREANIWNNIFAVSREAMIGEQLRVELAGGRLEVAGNLFFGRINSQFTARDAHSRTGNPLFAQPGGTNPEAYRLRPGSPALGGGITVRHPPFPAAGSGVFAKVSEAPQVDFFGTPLGAGPSIGAAVTVVKDVPQAPLAAR